MNASMGRHQHALETQRGSSRTLHTNFGCRSPLCDRARAAGPVRAMATDFLGGIRRAVYSVNQLLTVARANASGKSDPEEIDVVTLTRFGHPGLPPLSRRMTSTFHLADAALA
jgi:two-component system OmpR family sensor kinase